MLLLAGGLEFGRLMITYQTADKTMRNAARYLSMVPPAGVCTWGLTNARNLARFGTISPGQSPRPVIDGWNDASSIVLGGVDCSDPGAATVVRLSASIPLDLPLLGVITSLQPDSEVGTEFTVFVRHEERYGGS